MHHLSIYRLNDRMPFVPNENSRLKIILIECVYSFKQASPAVIPFFEHFFF
jgi:hypothetical protein